jgi:hypothetical protein
MSKRIGEVLMERGLLTRAQLQTALRTQEFFGGHLGSIFIELGFLKEQTLGDALAQGAGVRYAPPEALEGISREVHAVLSRELADKHQVVPLRVQGRQLHLAMLNPTDLEAMEEIASLTGLTVVPYLALEFRLREALERYYDIIRQRAARIEVEAPEEEVDLTRLEAATPAQTPSAAPGGDASWSPEPEIGLDGLPLHPEFNVERALTTPGPSGGPDSEGLLEQLPRNLEEWHGSGDEPPVEAVTAPPVATGPDESPAPFATAENPLAESARRLLQAEGRDQVAEILLQVTERFFRRRLLFIVQRDRIAGWEGRGEGVTRERVKSAVLPMDALSLFTAVKVGSRPMIGPVADVPANRGLFRDLGMDIPPEVVLLPVRIKDRVVAILYGDNGDQPVGSVDVDLLRRFTLQAAIALEILILRGKLLSL